MRTLNMIPDRFSVRGPEGTVPWVAIVLWVDADSTPSLVWARTREEAEGYIAANNRGSVGIRVFRVDPRHNLAARHVRLTELA